MKFAHVMTLIVGFILFNFSGFPVEAKDSKKSTCTSGSTAIKSGDKYVGQVGHFLYVSLYSIVSKWGANCKNGTELRMLINVKFK